MKIPERMTFLRALKLTLFAYIPSINRGRKKGGCWGQSPIDWFFSYWGSLLEKKHSKNVRYYKPYRKEVTDAKED